MKPWIPAILMMTLLAAPAMAHFVFVVPQDHALTAVVFLSETLSPDPQIGATYTENAKLFTRDAGGHDTPVALQKANDALTLKVPSGTRLIHGEDDLGVTSREADHPFWLIYAPKTIIGDPFAAGNALSASESPPVEIIPCGKIGAVQLELMIDGKPAADTELTILLPDGRTLKAKTDTHGLTEALTQQGRYGAWARDWEKTAGEHDGKKFTEIRR